MTYRGPSGVTVADQETGELRHESVWHVVQEGKVRELRLRIARGILLEGGWRLYTTPDDEWDGDRP